MNDKIICCDTCRYDKDERCKHNFPSLKCLVPSKYKIKWCKNGEEYIGKYHYFYYLWESKEINHLPEELFEI